MSRLRSEIPAFLPPEMEGSATKSGKKKSDVAFAQARRLSIIDVSSEDDSLLGLAPEFVQDNAFSEGQEQSSDLFMSVDDTKLEELFEPVDDNKLNNIGEVKENDELGPQPSESLEPEILRKNGKYNLRKSLAWDSAFFTCEGVLDAEELSSMISVEKGQKAMLPGIQEEVHRSSDSISTLGSDTLTLESVEANLFEDVRASIQRSSRAVTMAGESSKVGSVLKQNKVGGGLRKADLASQHKLKPKVISKKPITSLQNPAKMSKPVSTSSHLSQSVAASGESNLSLLKRPKVLNKPIPSTTMMAKRASLGGNLLKVEKDGTKIAAVRGAPVSKLPGSSRNVPRPPISSSVASSNGTTGGPTSSIDSSGSTTSVKFGKPSINSIKRKTDHRTSNPAFSGSNPKTPSKGIPGHKTESGKLRISAQITPSTKLSSSISPASSISDWSSESVSSISSLQQISCSSRDSFSRSSCRSNSFDFDAQSVDYQSQTDDHSSASSATRVSGSKASTGLPALPPTSKPSGLRLPSPKIGFFDGVKSGIHTPKRGNPVTPSTIPKTGTVSVSPRGSVIKSKLGKVNPERDATVSSKIDVQWTSSNSKNKISPLPKSSKAVKLESSSELRNAKSSPVISPIGKINMPLKFDLKNDDESGRIEDDIDLYGKDTVSFEKCMIDALKAEVTPENTCSVHREKADVILVSEEDSCVSESKSIPSFETPVSSLQVVEVAKHEEVEFITELRSIENRNENENTCFEDQLDCLIRGIGAMDIGGTIEMSNGDIDMLNSQQNISVQDSCIADSYSHQELPVFMEKDDTSLTLLKPVVSASPITNDNTSCERIPFSAKDSLCNISGSFGASKGPTVLEGEKNSELAFTEHFDAEQLT